MNIDWIISDRPVDYPTALETMERRVAAIRDGRADEAVWLLEHPPLYTAGTSAQAKDLLHPRFPVFDTGRGGQYTYHGPGQRVGYVMLDLKARQATPDIRCYVWQLEEWIIRTLAEFDIKGERVEGRVGIWVNVNLAHPSQPPLAERRMDGRSASYPSDTAIAGVEKDNYAKIAAIGVRVRRWVTYHGISINVNPDLSHFNGIVPCGISDAGVTSFHDLGKSIDMKQLDAMLQSKWEEVFQSAANGMVCART